MELGDVWCRTAGRFRTQSCCWVLQLLLPGGRDTSSTPCGRRAGLCRCTACTRHPSSGHRQGPAGQADSGKRGSPQGSSVSELLGRPVQGSGPQVGVAKPAWRRHSAAGPAKLAPGQHGGMAAGAQRGAARAWGPIIRQVACRTQVGIPSPQNCHHACMERLQGASWAGWGVCATGGRDMNPDKCGASGTQTPGCPAQSFAKPQCQTERAPGRPATRPGKNSGPPSVSHLPLAGVPPAT